MRESQAALEAEAALRDEHSTTNNSTSNNTSNSNSRGAGALSPGGSSRRDREKDREKDALNPSGKMRRHSSAGLIGDRDSSADADAALLAAKEQRRKVRQLLYAHGICCERYTHRCCEAWRYYSCVAVLRSKAHVSIPDVRAFRLPAICQPRLGESE